MDSKQSSPNKVLMLPWLAHGHITPFLELAKKLSTKNFYIYLCSTPINLTSIQNRITRTQSLSLELIPFHLPPSPDLPPHYHTTNGLPPHLLPTLIKTFQMENPSFSRILQTLRPDLVIYDFFRPRPPTADALEYKIPAVAFSTSGAAPFSFGFHIFKKPGVDFPFPQLHSNLKYKNDTDTPFEPHSTTPSLTYGVVPSHFFSLLPEATTPHVSESVVGYGSKSVSVSLLFKPKDAPVNECAMERRQTESSEISSKIILVNSFRELEGKYIDYLTILTEQKTIPIGPVVQQIVDGNKDLKILQWLGTKEELSTVFVSFGSESFLSKEEREEIAHGLELSGVNFIWIVRFPAEERIEIEEALPPEFLKRIEERGMVVEGWAPQAQILTHSSTGGFVSHCGWNSILESLNFGVPIIAVPMNHDQPINAKLVEEVGVGVEVKRDENRRLDRENIAQVIKKVVKDETGVDVRTKAREFSEIIRMKGERDIDGLVKELVQLCNEG